MSKSAGHRFFRADFYPYGRTDFSYTEDFKKHYDAPEPDNAYQNLLGVTSTINSPLNKSSRAIKNLDAIIRQAKNEEQKFFESHKYFNYDSKKIGEIIRDLNYIMGRKILFENAIQRIKQVNEDDTEGYNNIISYLAGYLKTVINDEVEGLIKKHGILKTDFYSEIDSKFIENIVWKAMTKMGNATDYIDEDGKIITNPTKEQKEKLQAIQPYTELLTLIKDMQNRTIANNFTLFQQFTNEIEELFHLRQNIIDTYNTKSSNKKNHERKRLPVITKREDGYKGTVEELLDQYLPSFGLEKASSGKEYSGKKIGDMGGKTDVILASVTGKIPYEKFQTKTLTKEQKQSASVRAKVIQTYKNFYKEIEDMSGDIIMISDKNYYLNTLKLKKRKGFEAQTGTRLKNVKALLQSVHSGLDIEGLIIYLANCGPGMILGSKESTDVLNNIATQIGHFLFDDLDMSFTVPQGVNLIHVFNLSGIYIPLSIYLESVQHALLEAQQEIDQLVHIHISYPKIQTDPWTETAFKKFRQDRVDNTIFNVYFFENFINFIASNL